MDFQKIPQPIFGITEGLLGQTGETIKVYNLKTIHHSI